MAVSVLRSRPLPPRSGDDRGVARLDPEEHVAVLPDGTAGTVRTACARANTYGDYGSNRDLIVT